MNAYVRLYDCDFRIKTEHRCHARESELIPEELEVREVNQHDNCRSMKEYLLSLFSFVTQDQQSTGHEFLQTTYGPNPSG